MYSKQGSLSMHLQRYEVSPKLAEHQQKISEVSSESITWVGQTIENRLSGTSLKKNLRLKLNRESIQKYRRFSTAKTNPTKTSIQNNAEDQDEILGQCYSLTERIEFLKKHKLEYVVHQFQSEERKKMEYLLQKKKAFIRFKYNQRRQELKTSYQKETLRLAKAFEDIEKLKCACLRIIEDLYDRRNNINKEYQRALQKVKSIKHKLIHEWKKGSNEEILKRVNKHF